MSKRKADANDIILDVDSEDIQSSSEEEKPAKNSKKQCPSVSKRFHKLKEQRKAIQVVELESSGDEVVEIREKEPIIRNGGKEVVNISQSQLSSEVTLSDNIIIHDSDTSSQEIKDNLNGNVVLDSEGSLGSSMEISGCKNKPPLMTIHFKDKRTAKAYKNKIKEFILSIIKCDNKDRTGSESETDLELDIWPEVPNEVTQEKDGLFFVDTDPEKTIDDIPHYSRVTSELAQDVTQEQDSSKEIKRLRGSCFNCQGSHSLKDCTEPKSLSRIAENRRAKINNRMIGRYHTEDEQRFGHLVPGRISRPLRYAMHLQSHEVPTYIYRMRMLGYPPGWLEEARICHSGITLFDSKGQEITDPDEEKGEVVEPGSKDQFDIKKIVDYPGFNVPLGSKYVEEGERYGFPPMSEQDSKLNMLQVLAPNAMKAYKRKKLSLFPSATLDESNEGGGEVEMELEEGEDAPDFPTLPPLPDDAPPIPPPPPPAACPSDHEDSSTLNNSSHFTSKDMIVIDECNDSDTSVIDLSLDELEEKKKVLMEALNDNTGSTSASPIPVVESENIGSSSALTSPQKSLDEAKSPVKEDVESAITPQSTPHKSIDKGQVKSTLLGTPIINAFSNANLPSEDKFSKDICDVINFENLPESIGTYKRMSGMLKRVKNEVDRINDS